MKAVSVSEAVIAKGCEVNDEHFKSDIIWMDSGFWFF